RLLRHRRLARFGIVAREVDHGFHAERRQVCVVAALGLAASEIGRINLTEVVDAKACETRNARLRRRCAACGGAGGRGTYDEGSCGERREKAAEAHGIPPDSRTAVFSMAY